MRVYARIEAKCSDNQGVRMIKVRIIEVTLYQRLERVGSVIVFGIDVQWFRFILAGEKIL